MALIRAGEQLSREFLSEVRTLEETIQVDEYVIEHHETRYLVQRKGFCDFLRCEAACCQMLCLKCKWNAYLEGFAVKGKHSPLIANPCKYLERDLSCSRWSGPDYPSICKSFPVPGDAMYLEVMDRCTFYFQMIRIIREERLDQLTS
ncbi:MAG: hypothetical protein ACOC0K_01425 [bacterium]